MVFAHEVTTDGAQAALILPCLSFAGLMLRSNYPCSCCIIYVLIALCVHKCVMLHKQYMIVLFYTCGKSAYLLSSPYN